ncbi:MAG TPA: ABC transporter permease [Pseudonocardiaceae bacterium]|jgi:ABC-2 type transport system permease protein|nr:ABC transporter permease [Pseudonocardiaceae bacterium]
MKTGYLALEAKRAMRSPRFLIFTLVFPVVLFLVYKGLYGSAKVQGTDITYTAYLMCSMAAFGGFMAAMSTGARTAIERSAGWQRQLRLTPLTPRGYLFAKAAVGMLVALPSIVLVSLAGVFSGVSLSPVGWVQVVVGVWIATLPFSVLGLLIGQLATAESMQVYTSGLMFLFGLLGGLWIPVTVFPNWLASVAKVLPSYWLADVGHAAVLGTHDLGRAAEVLGIWTLALAFVVVRRYQRDSARA